MPFPKYPIITVPGLPLPVLHPRPVPGPALDPLRLHGLDRRLRPPRHGGQGGVQPLTHRSDFRVRNALFVLVLIDTCTG